MASLRVVFMGTPEFAVPSLSEILSVGHEVVRVYTQSPQKAGRGQKLKKSPVYKFADIMGLPVETPASFRKSSVIDDLETLQADVACVVAYGQILPKRALLTPKYGALNLHASKLPRWRGAAPVQRAILAGNTQTAAQIIQMEKGLDTGPILLSETVAISETDTAAILGDKLSRVGAGLWPRALAALERGTLEVTPQTGVPTYAHKINKAESRIDWSRSARELDWHIRGLTPSPGAWFEIGNKRIKVHMARPESGAGQPGEVLDDKILIACGENALRLMRLQPAGKNVMSADEYLHGNPCTKGRVLA